MIIPMTEAELEAHLEPVVNPSGIWADFNPVMRWYEFLKNILPNELWPPEPQVGDYPNLTSPRSARWD